MSAIFGDSNRHIEQLEMVVVSWLRRFSSDLTVQFYSALPRPMVVLARSAHCNVHEFAKTTNFPGHTKHRQTIRSNQQFEHQRRAHVRHAAGLAGLMTEAAPFSRMLGIKRSVLQNHLGTVSQRQDNTGTPRNH